jgi:hypothetical protein
MPQFSAGFVFLLSAVIGRDGMQPIRRRIEQKFGFRKRAKASSEVVEGHAIQGQVWWGGGGMRTRELRDGQTNSLVRCGARSVVSVAAGTPEGGISEGPARAA